MQEQLKEIGQRLMVLREESEMTPAAVAAAIGVTEEDYLTHERGETDFSISFLCKAAELFGVDMLDLMSGESPTLSMCTVVKKGQGFEVKRNRAYHYKHLAYTFRNKKAEPFFVTVDPSDAVPEQNGHAGQEFDYMLSGRMMLYLGDTKYELEEGDSAYFDSSIPHALQALGDKPAEFLAVVLR